MMTVSRFRSWLGAALLLGLAIPLSAPAQVSAPDRVATPDSAATAPEPGALRTTRFQDHQMSAAEKIQILQDKLAINPIDGASWHELGVIQANREDWEGARDAFIRAVQCDKNNGDFHRSLGLVFARLDMPEMALNEFNEYRRLDQFGGVDYWRLLGGVQVKAGQVDEARATFREGLKAMSDPPQPEMFRLVLALRDLEAGAGDAAAARRLLEQYTPLAHAHLDTLTGADPSRAATAEAGTIIEGAVRLALDDAQAAETAGDLATAAARLQDAERLAPGREETVPRLVDLYLRQGRTAAADSVAAAARAEYPERPNTWIASGRIHEEAGRLEEALAAYRQGWQINKGDDERVAVANLYARLGKDAEAADWFRAGVTPRTRPEVIYNYGVVLMHQNKLPEAITQLQRVVKERPQMSTAWQALAQCLQNTGRDPEAIAACQQALALQPDAKVSFQLGVLYQKNKKIDDAIAAYQKTLELEPAVAGAQFNLGICLNEAKRYDEAAKAFDRLVEIEGVTYRAYYNQGLSFYNAGKYKEALDAFDTARVMEETPGVCNAMAATWSKLKDPAEAQKWLLKAKELQNAKK
jgi:tetratricopeptide (TPR) repeat protein